MLYIMRHGKTDWNAVHKLQGRTDIPLNEDGRMMAREAGIKYSNLQFDKCYCSPLKRAKETAQIFLENKNTPIYTDDRLKEMCFGIYEGIQDVGSNGNNPIKILFTNPEKYITVEGGESLKQLYDRTGDFLKEVIIPKVNAGENILIVGHGAMNCSIIAQLRKTPLNNFWDGMTRNCELVKLI